MVSMTRSWYSSNEIWAELTSIVVICVGSALACAPMFWYGASNGDDVLTSLVWMQDFSNQLAQGDLYPRWLMDMSRGAGSPAFYFYAPLPFYIVSIPAVLLSRYAVMTQLAWGDWLIIALSGVAFYGYARQRFGRAAAATCSMLYMLLPYHFETDMWDRQALGELANYIWMPVVLHYVEELFEHPRSVLGLAISYGLMVISHLPSTILFSICLVGYLLARAGGRPTWAYLRRFTCAVIVGLLLAAIYWVPALMSQRYIHAEAWWTWYFDFHLWLFPPRDLKLFRNDAQSYAFARRVFTVVSSTTVIFALFAIVAMRASKKMPNRTFSGYLALMGIAWFLMTSGSTWIWEWLPVLRKVQFPWRLAMVVDLATALVALHAVSELVGRRWRASAFIFAALGLLAWCLSTSDMKHRLDPYWDPELVASRDRCVRNGVDASEYTTRWSPYSETAIDTSAFINGVPMLTYERQHAEISPLRWRPREIKLSVHAGKETQVRVRQFYFPNWRARTEAGASIPLRPDTSSGLIVLTVPAGNYPLRLALEPLPEEALGAMMSVVGVILLSSLTIWTRRARATRQAPILSSPP